MFFIHHHSIIILFSSELLHIVSRRSKSQSQHSKVKRTTVFGVDTEDCRSRVNHIHSVRQLCLARSVTRSFGERGGIKRDSSLWKRLQYTRDTGSAATAGHHVAWLLADDRGGTTNTPALEERLALRALLLHVHFAKEARRKQRHGEDSL